MDLLLFHEKISWHNKTEFGWTVLGFELRRLVDGAKFFFYILYLEAAPIHPFFHLNPIETLLPHFLLSVVKEVC